MISNDMFAADKNLSYRLENRALALSFRFIIMLLSGVFFKFSRTLRVGFFLANLHDNGRMRAPAVTWRLLARKP